MLAEIQKDLSNSVIFFLHFLMMAATLLGLSGADKNRHRFEYFVHSSHVLIQEVMIVNFQEPMIPPVLFNSPVPEFLIRIGDFLTSGASRLGSLTW